MTEKRYRVFKYPDCNNYGVSDDIAEYTLATFDNHIEAELLCERLNELYDENEKLKQELKRCRDWINSDKNDYELTLSFIKNKGYSLKDVLEYEKEVKE